MQNQLKSRTKQIGLQVIGLVESLPYKPAASVISKQILRSSTSVGANYRAACRAKSDADFLYTLKIVEEETDETLYWLELLEESKIITDDRLTPLKKEVNELLAIIVTAIKSVRQKINTKPQSDS